MSTKADLPAEFRKVMTSTEFDYFRRAEEHNLTPKIIGFKKVRKGYEVKMQRCPITFLNYIDDNPELPGNLKTRLIAKIHDLIDHLHKLDIFHGDLHGNNIVYNPETEEVKLIDFGRSCDFDDVEDNIESINKFLNTETYLSSLDELLKYERNMFLLDI